MGNDTCARIGCTNTRAPKPPTGPRSPYCSKSCRNRASYARRKQTVPRKSRRQATAKTCPQCGVEFTPARTAKQKFCTRRCGQNFRRDSYGICSIDDCGRPTRAKGLCASHYNVQHPNRKTWKKNGNPDVRRAALRRKTQERRARTRGATIERVERDEIGERDGWICGICGLSINRNLKHPDPDSPSLDHIVPLALGGEHTEANTQISHLYCNTVKGARPLDEVA